MAATTMQVLYVMGRPWAHGMVAFEVQQHCTRLRPAELNQGVAITNEYVRYWDSLPGPALACSLSAQAIILSETVELPSAVPRVAHHQTARSGFPFILHRKDKCLYKTVALLANAANEL